MLLSYFKGDLGAAYTWVLVGYGSGAQSCNSLGG